MGASQLSKTARREDILNRLQSSTLPAVPTGELVKQYSVSPKTVRQDLNDLHAQHEQIKKYETTAGNLYEWSGRRSLAGDLRQVLEERSRVSVAGKLAVVAVSGYVGSTTMLLLPAWSLTQGEAKMATGQAEPFAAAALVFLALYALAVGIKKRYGEVPFDELPLVG